MALEDAVCLADTIERHGGSVEAAFGDYQRKRVVRTARVQLQSRAIGDHVYHPAGAHALVRNEIMRAKTSQNFYDDLAWLYGGPGLDGAVA